MKKPIPFGKYYLLERINVGGMAEVFKAKAFGVEGFERLVAVKRILPNIAEDEEFITMFIDEAKIAVQLQHANVAQIFDLGKVDDSYFIALEFVHGKDLRSIFDRGRQRGEVMSVPQACFVVMQVCEGLDYAHNKRDAQGRELNFVHRDISPQNVLIGYEGEIKLIDFGIAKAAGKASKTQAGILKGKFGYMSPEQVRGLPIDRRSDIFAVGIVLYELLTGERLFVGESDFSTLEKVRNVEILPPSSYNRKIPDELERIVLKALAKDVEDRYQNAIDLHDDLQAFLYTTGEFYSRKDLSGWMKKSFSSEIEDENAKLEQYKEISAPPGPDAEKTPGPPGKRASGANGAGVTPGVAAGLSAKKKDGDIAWDDEELETQIYDKPGDAEEVTSDEIVLEEEEGDRTAAGTPPAEIAAALGGGGSGAGPGAGPGLRAAGIPTTSFGGGGKGGPPPGLAGVTTLPYSARPGGGGPPPGLAGIRPLPAPESGPLFPGRPPSERSLPRIDLAPPPLAIPAAITAPMSLMDISDPNIALAGIARRPARGGFGAALVGIAVLAVAGVGYWMWREAHLPGQVQIVAEPSDVHILIDNVEVASAAPFTIEKPPGAYTVSVLRDSYLRSDQLIEVKPGTPFELKVRLEPAGETGFELTSDPPGQLVWYDDQPLLGAPGSDGKAQQSRTDFRATKMMPGRHLLEIKGDARYQLWRQEFDLPPAVVHKIHAALIPTASEPVAKASPPPSPPPRQDIVAAVREPTPVAPAPREPAPPRAAIRSEKPERERPDRSDRRHTSRVVVAAAAPSGGGEDPFEDGGSKKSVKRGGEDDEFQLEATKPSVRVSGGAECTVTLGSKPWSQVWIDGKNTNKMTPLADFKLPCGKHKFTFKRPDLKIDQSYTDQVRAGEVFKRVYTLLDTSE